MSSSDWPIKVALTSLIGAFLAYKTLSKSRAKQQAAAPVPAAATSAAQIIEWFSNSAEKYDEVIDRDKDYTAYDRIPAMLLAHGLPKKANVVDLGCGTGLGAKPFFAAGHRVTGLDITQKMIDKCQSLPFDKLICMSLEDVLPFADNTFDGAVLIGVMEFIASPDRLFADIFRVVANKGVFGVTFPLKLPADIEAKLEIRTYTDEDIHGFCSRAGFKLVQKQTFQGFVFQNETIPYLGLLLQKVV